MLIVPLIAQPAQTLAVTLANQPCKIRVYANSTGLYLDLAVNDVPVISSVLAHNAVRLVRAAYLGFTGDLTFLDTEGSDDPEVSGLGSRWVLAYLEAADL